MVWQQFGFLQDANSNGVQDEGEFQTLDEMGVNEIDLARQGQAQVVNGNVVFGTTTVQYTDGRTAIAGDVMFAERDADFPDWVQAELVSPDVAPKLDVPTPSVEQQANQFVQLASVQTSDTTPLSYVHIQDLSMSSGSVVATDLESQPVETQLPTAKSANDDLVVVTA